MYQKFYQKHRIAVIGLPFLIPIGTFAQSAHKWSGTIQSDKEESLPGVYILIGGRSSGIVSKHIRELCDKDEWHRSPIFSAIGFLKHRIQINSQSILNANLSEGWPTAWRSGNSDC